MEGSQEREVNYNQYCSSCYYLNEVDKDGFPVKKCEECQATPMNIDSRKPINYKEVNK